MVEKPNEEKIVVLHHSTVLYTSLWIRDLSWKRAGSVLRYSMNERSNPILVFHEGYLQISVLEFPGDKQCVVCMFFSALIRAHATFITM